MVETVVLFWSLFHSEGLDPLAVGMRLMNRSQVAIHLRKWLLAKE